MKERPIIFSAPMVRAILEGRKTMTRRILKPQPRLFNVDERGTPCQVGVLQVEGRAYNQVTLGNVIAATPKLFAVGDTLWVREAWTHNGVGVWTIANARFAGCCGVMYRATDKREHEKGFWWPSIHMPREFSRITLRVTGVKVERLQDISEGDAIAEGIKQDVWASAVPFLEQPDFADHAPPEAPIYWSPGDDSEDSLQFKAADAFARLWNTINGPDAWAENPWVVTYTFERLAT